jgi:ParB family chromosome partitioning protein
MADRLQMTKSWMSRYLELARLPEEVVACFQSPHVIGISHAARLAPVLGNPRSRKRVLAEAAALIDETGAVGNRPPPAKVVARLVGAAIESDPPDQKGRDVVLRDGEGRVLVRVRKEGRGDVGFVVPGTRLQHVEQLVEAIGRYLKDRRGSGDRSR